jgi:hypothetical protein
MPRKDTVGPKLVAFGGVVVDDVEDDLDAGRMEPAHHDLERRDALVGVEVVRMGGEEADRVVAPVVAQAQFDEPALVGEGMHRQELDGRHPELDQVIDDVGRRQALEGAPARARDLGMGSGHAADVGFVDNRVGPGAERAHMLVPGKGGIHHPAFRHAEAVVAPVEGEVGAVGPEAIAEMRVRPPYRAAQRLGVGVEQQLVGLKRWPLRGS